MAINDLWRLDATAQAALVRAREVSVAELVDAAIRRIERLNPGINAVITLMFEDARRQSTRGLPPDSPFAGVPLLLKDASIEIEGTPYYLGTRVLKDMQWRSRRTTETARRFRRAGFVVLGKTNTPALSSGITTEPAAFGPTRNPWDLARSAGGSSGGSAAAVAVGMTAVAYGADATGSLRYPAACWGVVTLKPSRGRMPHATPAGQPDPLDVWTEFVLARSVRDLAGVLDAVGGPARGDRFAAPPPESPYRDTIARPSARLRVGLLARDVMTGMSIDEECMTAVNETGALLAELGHAVDEAHPPALDGLFRRTASAIGTIGVAVRYAQVRWLAEIAQREMTPDDIDAESIAAAAAGERVTKAQLAEAVTIVTTETAPIGDWWTAGYDLLVTPTLRQPPWPLGLRGGAADAGVFPGPFSFTGQPAMSVPMHWTPAGLPVGVQIISAYGRDDVVLNIAAQLEAARPWAHSWPSIALR